MRRLHWIGLCFVLLTACVTSSESVPNTSTAKITMTWNGLPVFDYVEGESVATLKSVQDSQWLMDMGSMLTEAQMASLPIEKQEILKPNASYVPMAERFQAEADLYTDQGDD